MEKETNKLMILTKKFFWYKIFCQNDGVSQIIISFIRYFRILTFCDTFCIDARQSTVLIDDYII